MKKNSINQIVALSITLLFSTYLHAQPACNVDAAKFEFTMTFTAVLEAKGNMLNNPNDMLTAMSGNECRGQAMLKYMASSDKHIAFLTVYSNTQGEKISFSIYNSATQQIVSYPYSINFLSDLSVGLSGSPFIFSDTACMTVSPNKVQGGLPVGTLVGDFNTRSFTEPLQYELVAGEGDTHNNLFRIEQGKLFTAAILNAKALDTATICVRAFNDKGFSLTQTHKLQIETNVSVEKHTMYLNEAVYPNPFFNQLIIKNTDKNIRTVKITDVSGKIMTTINNTESDDVQINTTNWAEGMFFIQLHTNKGVEVIKTIKIKAPQ